MRCPKCGYNSFDHLDSCKKCGKDLVEYKQKFGIVSVLLPGQVQPADKAVAGVEESVVDEAVAAATTVAAGATAAGAATVVDDGFADVDSGETKSSDTDDFGFDFMGDSDEEEDLSFDELFEEAPADEDVEETLPSPEPEPQAEEDEFAFDLNEAGDAETESDELADDFGFDPASLADDESVEGADFSFEPEPPEADAEAGAEEDPKDPFDFPESVAAEQAPETTAEYSAALEPEEVAEEVEELLPATDAVVDEELVEAVEPLIETAFEPLAAETEEPLLVPEPEPVGALEPEATEEVPETVASAVSESEPLPKAVVKLVEPATVAADFCAEEPLAEESVVLETAAAVADVAVPEPKPTPAAEQKTKPDVPVAKEALLEPAPEQMQEPAIAAGSDSDPEAVTEQEALAAAAPAEIQTATVVAPVSAATALLPATGNRVLAFCCDLLLLALVGASFLIAAEAASAGSDRLLPSFETLLDLSVPYFLVLFSLAFGYFTLFHFLAGQTPGKMLAGLRVETLEGEPLLFSQAFLRSVGGLLQLLPLGFGYLAILASPQRRGWNDQLAGTRLISLRGVADEA